MLCWIVGFLYVLQACTSDAVPTRAAVLQRLVKHVALPELRTLASTQHALTTSLATLERAPNEATLAAATAAWKAAALAWVRVEALRVPVNDGGRNLLRAEFWPTRGAQIEELLHDGSALDADQIEALGVDVRGMYALERLLFTEPAAQLLTASSEGSRTRLLARALAQNVERHALELTQTTGTGDTWAKGLTHDAAASLSRFVNMTTASLEQLASERLGPALTRGTRTPVTAREIRGGFSGISSQLVQAQFGTIERLYLGDQTCPGIATLLKPATPAVEQHVRTLFRTAHTRLAELALSLDQLAQLREPRIAHAHTALKELERALKTEASSALGVTLTFESSDGD